MNKNQVKAAATKLAETYRQEARDLETSAPELASALRSEAQSIIKDLGLGTMWSSGAASRSSLSVVSSTKLPHSQSSSNPTLTLVDDGSEKDLHRIVRKVKKMSKSLDRHRRRSSSSRRARIRTTAAAAAMLIGAAFMTTFNTAL